MISRKRENIWIYNDSSLIKLLKTIRNISLFTIHDEVLSYLYESMPEFLNELVLIHPKIQFRIFTNEPSIVIPSMLSSHVNSVSMSSFKNKSIEVRLFNESIFY